MKFSCCSFNRYNARHAGYGRHKNISSSNLYVLHPASLILQNIRHSFDYQTSLTQTLRQRERKLAHSSNFLFLFTSNSYIINGWEGVGGGYSTNFLLKRREMSKPLHYFHVKHMYIKVKESRNRPGVAQRAPGDLGSQISMIFGT